VKGHLGCDVENDCQADVGNPSMILQKARNERSGCARHRNGKRKAENQNHRMVARPPATARTLSSDIEKSATVICQIAWTSVFRGSPSASAQATAPAASVTSIGAAEKARNSRQIFQHTHNRSVPPASNRADGLQYLCGQPS
jgi:hypothetical protein